jgi:Enoyl-(Acyl carrier protein) reductase
VNVVSPGPTDTPLFRAGKPEPVINFIAGLHPLKRLGQPHEIAPAVTFLASPGGSWVNGQNIRVNGVRIASLCLFCCVLTNDYPGLYCVSMLCRNPALSPTSIKFLYFWYREIPLYLIYSVFQPLEMYQKPEKNQNLRNRSELESTKLFSLCPYLSW